MELTQGFADRYCGGQIEIQNPAEGYLYRGQIAEGWKPCQYPRTNRVYSTLDVMGLRSMPVPR